MAFTPRMSINGVGVNFTNSTAGTLVRGDLVAVSDQELRTVLAVENAGIYTAVAFTDQTSQTFDDPDTPVQIVTG